MKIWPLATTLLASLTFFSASCHRNTGDGAMAGDEGAAAQTKALIEKENPFEGQPNEFCTVIRKLSAYDLNMPEDHYCLLDVCLEDNERSNLSINLGDETEPIMAAYTLIHVFENADEARQYADTYQIKDVLISE